MEDLNRLQKLEADIDIRIMDLWEHLVFFEDDALREMALRIARAAYGQGYTDAWREDRVGALFFDHGYELPTRAGA